MSASLQASRMPPGFSHPSRHHSVETGWLETLANSFQPTLFLFQPTLSLSIVNKRTLDLVRLGLDSFRINFLSLSLSLSVITHLKTPHTPGHVVCTPAPYDQQETEKKSTAPRCRAVVLFPASRCYMQTLNPKRTPCAFSLETS